MTKCQLCGSEISPFKSAVPLLLVVEGNDDKNFFEAISQHLQLQDRVQFYNLGGRSNLNGGLKAIAPEVMKYSISRIGVCIDAESEQSGTFQEAFQHVQTALQNAGLPSPREPMELAGDGEVKVAVMIMPDNSGPGMLETICSKSIENKPELSCIEEFFECLDKLGTTAHRRREEKSRIASFLAIQERPGLSVGVAAKKGIIDVSSGVFSQVKDFLERLTA